MPDTVLGLVLFLATLAPGYVFVRLAERRQPARVQSDLAEAVELVITGSLSSILSAIAVALVASELGLLDIRSLVQEPTALLFQDPLNVLGLGLAWFALSFLIAGTGSILIHGKPDTRIRPRDSVWRASVNDAVRLGREEGTVAIPWHAPTAIVKLLDGRYLKGYMYAYPSAPNAEIREISIQRPIYKRDDSTSGYALVENIDFLVIPTAQIAYVALYGRRS